MPIDRRNFIAFGAGTLLGAGDPSTPPGRTPAPLMLRPTASAGFSAQTLFTTSETLDGYRPPGVMDGTAAFDWDERRVRLFVNHELAPGQGYPFALDNGLRLTGARISWFELDKRTRRITAAGPAITTIHDRRGVVATRAEQINEWWGSDSIRGLSTLCSAQGYRAGELGFVDDLVLVNEEVSAREDHPHGGSIWALDVRTGALRAVPELGRGSWENVTAVATEDHERADGHIALLLGDDLEFGAAPLYLWVGRKQPEGDWLARNGLSLGQLYAWSATDGYRSPEDWNGTGAVADGRFVPLVTRDRRQAGLSGHDRDGYLDDLLLREHARRAGAFMFSRPEDLHTNPDSPGEAVFASTGHGRVFPADDWGTLYKIEVAVTGGATPAPTARLTILHDGDDFGDHGIRNADNLVWASDGMIYVQEDKATKLSAFGAQTGREASVWQLNPAQPEDYRLVAVVDRSAVWPPDARDTGKTRLGAWESSGILDISNACGTSTELLLLATVQAHSVRGGSLGSEQDLFQASQLVLLSKALDNA